MTVHKTYTLAFLRRPDVIATMRLTHTCVHPTIQSTTPGSFGERARSRSEGAGACFFSANNCATPNPRLARVQDPFGNLLAKVKGSVLVSHAQVINAGGD